MSQLKYLREGLAQDSRPVARVWTSGISQEIANLPVLRGPGVWGTLGAFRLS